MKDCNLLVVCRLCLDSDEKMGELNHHLIYIISTCFSLKVGISSELTNKICQACVDQLENVYKYRKKIIRNELILLKKSRESILNYSEPAKELEIIDDRQEESGKLNVKDEPESNDSHTVFDEDDTNTEIKDEDIIKKLEIQYNKDTEKTSASSLKTEWLKLDDLNIVEKDIAVISINKSLKDHQVKLNNSDVTNGDNEDIIINNLAKNENPSLIISPIPFGIDQNDSKLEIDKENTNMNDAIKTELIINENEIIFNDQAENVNGINQNQFNALNIDRKFMCLTCLKVFTSQKELSTHYKNVELPKAVKMTEKYKDSNMVQVSKVNDGESVYSCVLCSKVFQDKASTMKHTLIHKAEWPFLCNLCSRTYKTVADIVRHGVVHNGSKLVCSYACGYTTVHSGALREHVKRHRKEFKYKCEKCGKCFQVKTWYDQHQNVHDKVRPFVCKLCGQAFSMARYLTTHRANVHPQSSKVKRYKCVHCGLPCDCRRSLVIHMKENHGMKTDCLCDVCGQILSDQQKLFLHKRIHEASRKFSCRFCKKTFNKKDHKTVHEKIHTGERLNCNNCPKSFTQRCSLRRHIKRYHQADQQNLDEKT